MKINNKVKFLLAPVALLLGVLGFYLIVHAGSYSFSGNINQNTPVGGSCLETLTGMSQNIGVLAGDSVNLSLTNNYSGQMDITWGVNGGTTVTGPASIASGGTASYVVNVGTEGATIAWQSDINPGCFAHNLSSETINVDVGSGTLACALIDSNTAWNVTGGFTSGDGTGITVMLYEGSTPITASPSPVSQSFESVNGIFNWTTPPTSDVTFYLYDGDSSSALLAQATCPAPPATPVVPSSSSSSGGTKSAPKTTTTVTTTTTTVPVVIVSPSKSITNASPNASLIIEATTTKKTSSNWLVYVLVIVILLGVGYGVYKIKVMTLKLKKKLVTKNKPKSKKKTKK